MFILTLLRENKKERNFFCKTHQEVFSPKVERKLERRKDFIQNDLLLLFISLHCFLLRANRSFNMIIFFSPHYFLQLSKKKKHFSFSFSQFFPHLSYRNKNGLFSLFSFFAIFFSF